MKLDIYTDGATSGNGQLNAVGGWGYIVIQDNTIIHKKNGQLTTATNNICELTAILEACEYALSITSKENFNQITIYSDSAYCINCYLQKWYIKWQNNGWVNSKKQPVANKELWIKLIPFFENLNFTFKKIKGHAGDVWNEEADQLAVKGKQGVLVDG